jgi:hypothetical protein
MQARHNRRFRQSLAGRHNFVAVRPTCGRKSVLRKIKGRAEETSDILSPLSPTCATRPSRCTGDTDRRGTCPVPFWDWRRWYTQPVGLLEGKKLSDLMYAFIYRLYKPEHFADPSYVDVKPDVPQNSVEYTLRIAPPQTHPIDCPGFFPLFASSPFGTRTHVLTNPLSDVRVNDQELSVTKDQLCQLDTRFDEQSILHDIHQPVKVPGVVEAVHSETIESSLYEGKQKHRLGLRQTGSPFMSIPTVQEMLETLYDALEGNSDSISRLRRAHKFASAAISAFRAENPSSGYKQREHLIYSGAKELCARCPLSSRSWSRRRLPLLHKVYPWRQVCILIPILSSC